MKRKIKNGILFVVGYILSPLSWWNDLFINIPLAYMFALLFGIFSKKLFSPMMIVGYWMTNIIGFVMMHYGVENFVSKDEKNYTRKKLIKDVIISIVYTGIIVFFVLMGWLKFPAEYFS